MKPRQLSSSPLLPAHTAQNLSSRASQHLDGACGDAPSLPIPPAAYRNMPVLPSPSPSPAACTHRPRTRGPRAEAGATLPRSRLARGTGASWASSGHLPRGAPMPCSRAATQATGVPPPRCAVRRAVQGRTRTKQGDSPQLAAHALLSSSHRTCLSLIETNNDPRGCDHSY